MGATTDLIVNPADVQAFQDDGVVIIRGLFKDWVETLRAGIDHNMQQPGEFGKNYTKEGQSGQFFGDYCNWQRIPQYHDFFFSSPAAPVTAQLIDSETVRIFHEHVLVKEPGTAQKLPGIMISRTTVLTAAKFVVCGYRLIRLINRFVLNL